MIYQLTHTYHPQDSVLLSGELLPKEADLLVFYLQAFYHEMIEAHSSFDLSPSETATVLQKVYDFQPITKEQLITAQEIYSIDLYDNWERFCGYQYVHVLTDRKLHHPEVEATLWQIYNAQAKGSNPQVTLLAMQEVPYRPLGLWIHETILSDALDSFGLKKQPVVFIQGLSESIIKTLQTYFPEGQCSKPYNSYSFAIPLQIYPLSDYLYQWDGKHILISFKNQWQLRIRYDVDILQQVGYPIKTPFALKQVLLKMGYQ